MISRDDATRIAEAALIEAGADISTRPEIVITQVVERDFAWVFSYQSKKFIETGDFKHALIGNGPLLVHKHTKRYVIAATFPPIHERIAEAERWLDSMGVAGGSSVAWDGPK